MTVARLTQELSVEEMRGWAAFFELMNEKQEAAMKKPARTQGNL